MQTVGFQYVSPKLQPIQSYRLRKVVHIVFINLIIHLQGDKGKLSLSSKQNLFKSVINCIRDKGCTHILLFQKFLFIRDIEWALRCSGSVANATLIMNPPYLFILSISPSHSHCRSTLSSSQYAV